MYLDFQNLNIDALCEEYSFDSYYSSVIDFLNILSTQDSFICYTSGSTGSPNSLTINKSRAVASAKLSNDFFQVKNNAKFLLCLDQKFIGARMMLVRAYIAGANIEIVKPSLDFYKHVVTKEIDFISLTPLHVFQVLKLYPSFFDRVKVCLIGGSGVSPNLENQIKQLKSRTRFYESFGMTETLSHFALRNISEGEKSFRLLNGFQISVDNENCLEVYHESIISQKIVTNDLVNIHSDGRFSFIGRKDNIVNTGGLKLSPEYFEKEWSAFLPGKFILAGEPDPILQEKLVIIFHLNSKSNRNEIIRILQNNFVPSRYMPKEYYYSESWSETKSNKPKRSEIVKKIKLLD